MKAERLISLCLFAFCSFGVQAQTPSGPPAPVAPSGLRYPEPAGAMPDSTLRMREIPAGPGTGAPAAPVVRDTPESVALYRQCQEKADRETVTRAELQAAIAGCLNALTERRQSQQ